MPAYLVLGAVVGAILTAGTLRGNPGKEAQTERIARPSSNLGAPKREARGELTPRAGLTHCGRRLRPRATPKSVSGPGDR